MVWAERDGTGLVGKLISRAFQKSYTLWGSDEKNMVKLHEIRMFGPFLVNMCFFKCNFLLTVSADRNGYVLVGKLDPRAFQRYIYHPGAIRGTCRSKRSKGYIWFPHPPWGATLMS